LPRMVGTGLEHRDQRARERGPCEEARGYPSPAFHRSDPSLRTAHPHARVDRLDAEPLCVARATLTLRAMTDTRKIAKNLERFAQAVAAHDRENPTHTAHGIALAHFDIERLGFEEGEEILPGITIHADSGVTGNFRVLCDGEHDEGAAEAEEEAIDAVATGSLPMIVPGAPPFPFEQ
jgi:hypothetical protein